jgi:ligand-binding sensor domain-containing protein/two-component sensor histidine kinase
VGTNGGGLNKYNYETNSFERYFTDSYNNLRKIFEDSNGSLWIGTNNSGLIKFDPVSKTFEKIIVVDNKRGWLSSNNIRDISEDNKGNLIIATEGGGVNIFDRSNNSFKVIDRVNSNNYYLNIKNIWSVLVVDSILWIGAYSEGLIKFDLNSFTAPEVLSLKNNNGLIGNNITALHYYDNHLWVCTEKGLSVLNTQNNSIANYQNNFSDIKSLSNNIIRSIYRDSSNLIWLGTFGGGVNKVNLKTKFKFYAHDPVNKNSLAHNMVRALYEDSNGNLWIGTMGNGLNKYNRSLDKFERFGDGGSGFRISENIITSILEDNENKIWVGTWGGGLNIIDFEVNNGITEIKNIKYLSENSTGLKLSSNIVQALFEDSNKNIWIGTEEGLDIYVPSRNKIINFKHSPDHKNSISDNRIQSKSIIEDKFGSIWIGTWKGLNKSVFNNNASIDEIYFQHFRNVHNNLNSLSDNRVISIYEDVVNSNDSINIIWIGTIGGGLNKLEYGPSGKFAEIKDYKFTNYSEKDGLPNDVIYGILGDDLGNLWLSTNNGLSKFESAKRSFKNYYISDGLQSNQFFWGAFEKTKDGELFFGSIKGLNSFYPKDIVENEFIPPVYITKFEIAKDNEVIELNTYSNLSRYEFEYGSYSLTINFASLDFTAPSNNKFKYRLKGYDNDWRGPTTDYAVTYSNLNEGDYEFEVVGSNNDGVWNNNGSSISFVVLTPVWKSWWFILILILIIIGAIIYFVIVQINNLLAVERLRTKLAADLHDNIGSSLTEISILSEVISTKLNKSEKDVVKYLNKISAKSRDLIDKMSDIVWLVNPKRDSLYDLILRLQDTYSELLSETNISLRSENLKSLEKTALKMEDRQHLFLIFKEAINNSIMHGKCTEITLNAHAFGRKMEMTLIDNGRGFDKDDSRGNGLDNMKLRAESIGGKLFIESKVGVGTVIKYIGYIN